MLTAHAQTIAVPDLGAEWVVAYGNDGRVIVLVRDDDALREVADLAGVVYECTRQRIA